MGCGCPERKERVAKKAEKHELHGLARLIRKIPSPGGNQEDHRSEAWSMHDLPMSGKTSIGGTER